MRLEERLNITATAAVRNCGIGTRRVLAERPIDPDILVYIISPGSLIREHREGLGLSQRSLARRSGLTQAAISRIERGVNAPNWETVRSLLLAMGYDPELRVRRLRGRWDPVHMAALRERSPAERFELAISANRLAGRLRQAALEAGRGS